MTVSAGFGRRIENPFHCFLPIGRTVRTAFRHIDWIVSDSHALRDGNLCGDAVVVSINSIRNVNVSLVVTDITPQSA
ncbi:MAG: hypothetical protein BGO89_09345 [Candidatus Kapaibacterium thiocyanatum]|uniref:Uncharacterized protein n=1 Tax=Candidatus Kapaibacterium thiocyanatum TaxID=1895771 RepID=A0A1M3KWA2_9BACT|nr:MAG: hypothetical protein BGO89_09345 ['Candidatus Kapabacteria' thiocyanatum]